MAALNTNLAELPVQISIQLCNCLNAGDIWVKLLDEEKSNLYYFSSDEVERYGRMNNPAEYLLRLWGNRGQTVHTFLARLQALSKVHGSLLDRPQLVLQRKFKELKWSRPEEIVVSIITDGTELKLECRAIGFPFPHFQWIQSDTPIEGANSNILIIPRCKCSTNSEYRCKTWNEVPIGLPQSDFYRRPGKQFSSVLESKNVDLMPFINEDHKCEQCRAAEYKRLCEVMGEINDETTELLPVVRRPSDDVSDMLIAADKVALIISNCSYQYLPELVTPHCDAETLAQALQDLKFKTVTLADLTLEEMRTIIKEYRRLLGNGVYAVFYFVGHGFEVNGQCYLLPIDAPGDAHLPEHCLSMDWILHILKDFSPALNLMLLDVCRKFIPIDSVTAFVSYAEPFKRNNKPNRNTVYGYSTSGGVGAYEVKGEINGVFMKYLKNHVTLNISVIDMLNRVFRDIENDEKVRAVQIPELRSTLTQPRSLQDHLVFDGHTVSYDHHTIHWRLMHELPNPVIVRFPEEQLTATIFFDFCGHFTNKVYVYSSVGDLQTNESCDFDEEKPLSEKARKHLALLVFPEFVSTSKPRIFEDDQEGVSFCLLLSHLQRFKGEVSCVVQLQNKDNPGSGPVATSEAALGHVLITRIGLLK